MLKPLASLGVADALRGLPRAGLLAAALWGGSAGWPTAAQAVEVPARAWIERHFDRERARRRGEVLRLTDHLQVNRPASPDPWAPKPLFSSDLDLVFHVGGPGWFGAAPEYHLVEGTYYVFDPRDWSDPTLQVRAEDRNRHQRRELAMARRALFARARERAFQPAGAGGAGQGIEISIMNSMPSALAAIVGRGGTNIRVTGRESISFAGESRRVSPFIQSEQGRGQSLFPRLDMDQDLQVKLEGTIGDKVHVEVDHNSSAFGLDANRIKIWYEGYEDDIVRRVDLGGTNLNLPGSNLVSFSGGAQGLFGVKTDMRIGGLDLTVIASKQESEAETRTLTPSGGTTTPTTLEERNYVRNQFFFYVKPNETFFSAADSIAAAAWETYGIDVGFFDNSGTYVPGDLLDQSDVGSFQVFIDDNNASNEAERRYLGYAYDSMAPQADPPDTLQWWNAFLSTPSNARWPREVTDPYTPGRWRRVDDEDIGYVFFQNGNRQLVLGFYLRNGALSRNAALAVAYRDPRGNNVGQVVESGAQPEVRLRLLRHPDQETADEDVRDNPTSVYMMRHVYRLGTTNISEIEVNIESQQSGKQNPGVPDNIPTSTYLHMFGLDELDDANRAAPDGVFDAQNPNLWDRENGFLFLPGLRPFSPPDSVVAFRLRTAGVAKDLTLFQDELVSEKLYTLPDTDQGIPSGEFRISVRSSGTETEIVLPSDIIEGTDQVRLNGRVLQRGVDYDIEPFAGGRITFRGDVVNEIDPSSRIEVSYQFRPLVSSGSATLFGASGQYDLGTHGRLASVWLFETTRGFSRRPRLGEEPTRTLVGDVNASLRFQPNWMTRLVDLLPFTETSTPSALNLSGEAAISLPNPNTRNTAFVEDLESAEDSDVLSVSRNAWHWASIPDVDAGAVRSDTLYRVPVFYYNPVGEVKRGHLNPLLDETEADDGLTVLELGFDQEQLRLLAAEPGVLYDQLWSGVMTAFPGNGLDLTQSKSIEFWFNDEWGDPANRRGKMHIDFGDMSEDFVFFPNNPNRNLFPPQFNREAETEQDFQAQSDDVGWNGRDDDCEATSLPRGSDCHRPSARNADEQHAWANGTEDNNEYDTEDINGNGRFDLTNRFFRLTIDLADSRWVETDVQKEFGTDPNIPQRFRDGFEGWRKYRIDFEEILNGILETVPAGSSPSLRQIRYLRVWFEDPSATGPDSTLFQRDLQLYDFKFTGNQWLELGTFAQDSSQVFPEPGEVFSIGVINNKDNPEYVLPPDAEDLDAEGVQSREQSLRINFTNLQPGHEVVAQRTFTGARGLDFTQYRQLNYFVHYPTAAGADSGEFFFRVGTDTLNYYEISHEIPSRRDWMEINVELDSLTGLKFFTDVAGAQVDSVVLGGRRVLQVSAPYFDANEKDLRLTIRRRGEPSLKALTRLMVGVRHRDPRSASGTPLSQLAAPVSGEVWFDNVRLEEVDREIGVAQSYAMQSKWGDVFDVTSSLSLRDADFRSLRQRAGSGSESMNFQTRVSTELSRIVPTLGFSIPMTFNYNRSLSKPKFFSQSDTRNTEERKQEQRSEGVRRTFSLSFRKNPSKFWLFKPTLDRLQVSWNHTREERRTFATRDTSDAWSQNVNYDLQIAEHKLPLWKLPDINVLPTNIQFSAQHQSSRVTSYTVSRIPDPANFGATRDSLVRRATSPQRSLNLRASAAFRPLPSVSLRYNFTQPRTYRDAHPVNEAERIKIFGFDLGIPGGQGESFALDWNPRALRFGYTSNYSDRRNTTVNLPDTHNASFVRTRNLSFDFGLHRRIASWKFFQPPAQPPRRTPPPRADDADADDGATPPDSASATPRRPLPNPLKFLVRRIGMIDPVKVEWTDSRRASYVGMPSAPRYGFRLGLRDDSGIAGFRLPTPVDRTRNLDLSTAIPLRGALRISTRYGRRETLQDTRTTSEFSRNRTLETTFPNLELSINNLQKLRIFGSRLERSTLSLGMSRAKSQSARRFFDLDGEFLREQNPRSSIRLGVTSNWTGQWKGGVSTTLSFNHSSTENEVPGLRTQNIRRTINGSMRFKLNPKGGLKLPILGTLRTGMDVLFSGSFNADENRRFDNPDNPGAFKVDRRGTAMTLSARGDYTLSRSMTGGLEVGFTRNTRRDRTNQTITSVRLGFNLTFLF